MINQRVKGFTLIEMVTVVVILAIVSIGVTSYIRFGIDIYQDTVGRQQQISNSRFLIERLTRELREALPNSIRVNANNSCIEFVPIVASSSYITAPIAPALEKTITVVKPAFAGGDKVVIYPLTSDEVYRDPKNKIGKVFEIKLARTFVSANVERFSFKKKVQFTQGSPTNRYFVVNQTISYCATNQVIKRYSDYWAIGAQQSPPTSSSGVLMAQNQVNPRPFIYQGSTLVRNAVVQLNFEFSYDDELLKLYHEVHVVNVP